MEKGGLTPRGGSITRTIVLSLAVFLLISTTAIFLSRNLKNNITAEYQEIFNRGVLNFLVHFDEQKNVYTQELFSVQGLFGASNSVERDEWRSFIGALGINVAAKNSPAYPIYAMAYIERVMPGGLEAFIKGVRQDKSIPGLDLGQYRVFPSSTSAEYFPIKYVELSEGQPTSLGFDIGTFPLGRETLLKASAEEDVVSTGDFEVQFIGEHGVIAVLPVYGNKKPHSTPEEREANLQGFVAAVFKTNSLLKHFSDSGGNPFINMEVFSGKSADPNNLIYKADELTNLVSNYQVRFKELKNYSFYGKDLAFRFNSAPQLDAEMDARILPGIVLYGGFIVAFLLAILAYFLMEEKNRVLRLANKMTIDLRASEDRYRTAFSATPDLISITRLSDGMILEVNEGYTHLLGYARDESIGKTTTALSIWPDDSAHNKFIAVFNKLGEVNNFEMNLRRKDGTLVACMNSARKLQFEGEVCILLVIRDITEHKFLEDKLLEESEDRYRALFLASRDAVMTLEPPSWKFTSGNLATIKMFGVKTEAEFVSAEPWRLSPEFQPDGRSSMEKAKEMIDNAMREGRNLFEWTHRRINGEDFPAEVLLSRVEYGGKSFLHAVVRDITERKKTEEKLKEYQEEKFKIVFDSANDGMVLVNAATKKITLCNKAFLKMTGYTSEDIKNMAVTDIHPKENLPHILELFEKQLKGEITTALDIPVKRKDNSIFFVDINSSPIIIAGEKLTLGVFRDITERKKTADELMQFRLAVDSASDHIIITDPKGTIIYANKAAGFLTGYTSAEMVGKNPNLWGGQMPKEFYKKMWQRLSVEKKPFHGQIKNKRKDGELYDAFSSISPVLDEAGNIIYYVGVERDATQELEINRSKSEFVSLASHQLRTPLSAINWYSEMLLGGDAGALNPKQKDYTSEIYASSRRMAELVSALLNVSRIELGTFAIEPKPLDIRDVVISVLKELDQKIKSKNLAIVQEYSKDVPTLLNIDPNLTRIIFQNLISNSVKYTPDGGKITISIFKTEKDIVIEVVDSGYGIPLHQQRRVFEKFFRADNIIPIETDGTGLGLYIIKEVVEKIGGTIRFESEENIGTKFYITIPIGGMNKLEGTKSLGA